MVFYLNFLFPLYRCESHRMKRGLDFNIAKEAVIVLKAGINLITDSTIKLIKNKLSVFPK